MAIELNEGQLAVLRELKDMIKPADQFEPQTIEDLIGLHMLRRTRDDKAAITGSGLDYLRLRGAQGLGSVKTATVPPTSTEMDATGSGEISQYSRKVLAQIVTDGKVTSKSIHPPTRSKLLDAGLIMLDLEGLLVATEAGRKLAARFANSNGGDHSASAHKGSEPPLPVEIPHSAQVSLEVSVEAGTLPEAVDTLHEIADAIGDAAQTANPDYDPHIDELLAKPEAEVSDDDRLAGNPRPFEEFTDQALWDYVEAHHIRLTESVSRAELIALLYRYEGTTPVETRQRVYVEVPHDMEAEVVRLIQDRVASRDEPVETQADFSEALRASADDYCDCVEPCRAKRVLDQLMAASPEIAAIYDAQAALDRGMAKVRGLG